MKRLLFLTYLLLIGSAHAMGHYVTGRSSETTKTGAASSSSSSGKTPTLDIRLHTDNGYTYQLDDQHAATFVWNNQNNEVSRSLTSEQVVRLNSQFIWEILRREGNSGKTRVTLQHAENLMSPRVFTFLRKALNSYSNDPSSQPQLCPSTPLPTLSTNEHDQLISACNFLMAPDILTAIQNYFSPTECIQVSPPSGEHQTWQARLKNWWQKTVYTLSLASRQTPRLLHLEHAY